MNKIHAMKKHPELDAQMCMATSKHRANHHWGSRGKLPQKSLQTNVLKWQSWTLFNNTNTKVSFSFPSGSPFYAVLEFLVFMWMSCVNGFGCSSYVQSHYTLLGISCDLVAMMKSFNWTQFVHFFTSKVLDKLQVCSFPQNSHFRFKNVTNKKKGFLSHPGHRCDQWI